MSINRINIGYYLDKHGAEFPSNRVYHELPMPTDAISVVSDPENWTCFPENVVRIYLVKFASDGYEWHLVGVGDFQHPTVCTKLFDSLDDACAFIAYRPEAISRAWLEQSEFQFHPLSKPYHIM